MVALNELRSGLFTGYGAQCIGTPDVLALHISDIPGLLIEQAIFTVDNCAKTRTLRLIYFARRSGGMVKIGISRKPRRRCQDIARDGGECGLRLIIGCGSGAHERRFHQLLRREAVPGHSECFRGFETEMMLALLCQAGEQLGDIDPVNFGRAA